MGRLTVTLPDELHRALKEAAARRSTSIGEIIAESLDFYGIKSGESAASLVAKSRRSSRLPEKEAIRLAVAETRASRRR